MIRRHLHHQQSPSPPLCSVQTVPSSQTSLSSNCLCFYNLREGLLNLVCLRDFLILVSFLYSPSLKHLPPGGDSSTWRKQQANRQVSAIDLQAELISGLALRQVPVKGIAGNPNPPTLAPPNTVSPTLPPGFPSGHLACPQGAQQSPWKHSGSLLQPLSAHH